jgi:hypothetical protein
MLKHFSLGPVLSPRVDEAQATPPLNRTRWEHGVVVAAKAFDQPRSGYGAAQVFLGAGLGVVVGTEFSGLPLLVQFLIGGAAGLVVYWGVPTAWAVVGWWRAPKLQRDQARKYARALEAYAHDYAQWARRREIAYDFRHDTLNDVARFRSEEEGGPILMGSVADEETRWRSILTNIGAQMEQNGADVSAFIDAQLAFLDNEDGSFEGGDIALIRNSMLAACQNLLSEVRQEGPPTAPTPPQPEPGAAFQL